MSFLQEFIDGQSHKHVLVNFLIVLLVGIVSIPLALLLSISASVGKEIYDELSENGTKWSWIDIFGDVIGIALGLLLLGVICR